MIQENNIYYSFDPKEQQEQGLLKYNYKAHYFPTKANFYKIIFVRSLKDLNELIDHWNSLSQDWSYIRTT